MFSLCAQEKTNENCVRKTSGFLELLDWRHLDLSWTKFLHLYITIKCAIRDKLCMLEYIFFWLCFCILTPWFSYIPHVGPLTWLIKLINILFPFFWVEVLPFVPSCWLKVFSSLNIHIFFSYSPIWCPLLAKVSHHYYFCLQWIFLLGSCVFFTVLNFLLIKHLFMHKSDVYNYLPILLQMKQFWNLIAFCLLLVRNLVIMYHRVLHSVILSCIYILPFILKVL